jgi:predicted metalloendopeptidase
MSDALGRMYAERYFPAAQKARVQVIAANVIAALRHRVEAVAWMSPDSKKVALAKLQTLYVGLGYPEEWQDYSDLAVDPMDAVGNIRRVADRNYRRALARLGRPVDRHEWWMAPQTVGAILVFQQNALDFPAALLQGAKFDPSASDAAAYGAIGAIIGHESSHFIDPLGAEYEVDGRNRRWWTPEDFKQFQAASEPLVNQFAGYHPFPDLAINGKLTLSENIADLGGLAAAFDAYRLALGSRAADKDYVRQQDREFFIAFARSWRSKSTESALRTQAATNDHAPETYRIATVRNLDAWYDAFDVRPGQRLYLEPKARVRIW